MSVKLLGLEAGARLQEMPTRTTTPVLMVNVLQRVEETAD